MNAVNLAPVAMNTYDVFNDFIHIHAQISDPLTDAQHHILMILLTCIVRWARHTEEE
jgi:hypothetical protein